MNKSILQRATSLLSNYFYATLQVNVSHHTLLLQAPILLQIHHYICKLMLGPVSTCRDQILPLSSLNPLTFWHKKRFSLHAQLMMLYDCFLTCNTWNKLLSDWRQWRIKNFVSLRKVEVNKKCLKFSCLEQGCQFRSVSLRMAETFHTNLKNKTKQNKFHLILNLGPFWIFQLNSARNISVSFHMFCSALEKLLNQIERCWI
jgi:hypothetical protein